MTFPVLQSGSSGEAVRHWQKFLKDQDMPLDMLSQALDGMFGSGTKHGTLEYQKSRDLPASGVVDAETYAKAVADGFDETADL